MMKFPTLVPSTSSAFFFSLRTTLASLIALAIAFWMELGQPQWAAMTVWIVAQNSRGMSLSKGRWRVAGTLIGMVGGISLIGLSPQHAWIFFILLALWVGGCTVSACLFQSFRGYALVLAGYTGAIIALSAAEQPDHVFYIAMSRGTYILLGVVCEMLAGMIAVPGAAQTARDDLQKRLSVLMADSARALASVARNQEKGADNLSHLLGSLQSFNDQLEFIRIDSRRASQDADRAYFTLEKVAVFLSRGLGLRSRMAASGGLSEQVCDDLIKIAVSLEESAPLLMDPLRLKEALNALQNVLKECQEILRSCLPRGDNEAMQECVILTGVEVLLQDFYTAVESHYAGTLRIKVPDDYRLHRRSDQKLAWMNAVRAAVAMLLGAFVWEVTAWSNGQEFLSMLAVVCARFTIMDNMVLVSKRFFYGAVWAVLGSIVPVFIIMPVTSSYMLFGVYFGLAMFLGGIALRYPNDSVVAMAASYVNFFPWIIGLENQGRLSEMRWFNQSLALLLALWCGVMAFRIVLPFTVRHAWIRLRYQLVDELHKLNYQDIDHDQHMWIDDTTQRMEQAIRFAGKIPQSQVDEMVRGTLAVMTVGRNLLMLRQLVSAKRLPLEILKEGERLVGGIIQLVDGKKALSLSILRQFQDDEHALKKLFHHTSSLEKRHDLAFGLGALQIIQAEYQATYDFLQKRPVFCGKEEGI